MLNWLQVWAYRLLLMSYLELFAISVASLFHLYGYKVSGVQNLVTYVGFEGFEYLMLA